MSTLALLGGTPVLTREIPPYNSLGPEETRAVAGVMTTGRLSEFFGSFGDNFLGGRQVKAFEAEWSKYFEVPHSVTVNSASSGLAAAVNACGIGPGDEVIVSPFTMTVSASCVRTFGATPVFADIDEDTYNITAATIERVLTPRTKAIIAVDLAGQPADFDEIMALARPRGIKVIEDAAQAPYARYGNRWAGTLADIGVFSLNYHKTIHTGEGGVCCTHDATLARRLQLIRNHGEAVVEEMGLQPGDERILGFNFRLGELESAIGREQLKKLEQLTKPRQELAAAYDRRLGKLPGLKVPRVKPDRTHAYYTYMMRIDAKAAGVSRRQVTRALEAEGVPVFEGYCRPLYLQPLYRADWPGKDGRRYGPGLCPVTERLYEHELFYMTHLHAECGGPVFEGICAAFEKVWDQRRALAAIEDDGARNVRRA